MATQRRTRRILSIDGGGIRGVFSAAVIQQMEEKAGKSGLRDLRLLRWHECGLDHRGRIGGG